MGQLNINTGVVGYTVNDSCEIFFNPANPEFAGKVVKAFQKCTEISQTAKAGQDMQIEELLTLSKSMDTAIRAEIDAAFGEPVCDKVFGHTNALSLAGGLPVWANFLMAVIDEIDRHIPEEQKKSSPAVQKYIKKHEAKYGKKKHE